MYLTILQNIAGKQWKLTDFYPAPTSNEASTEKVAEKKPINSLPLYPITNLLQECLSLSGPCGKDKKKAAVLGSSHKVQIRIGVERNHTVLLLYESVYILSTLF